MIELEISDPWEVFLVFSFRQLDRRKQNALLEYLEARAELAAAGFPPLADLSSVIGNERPSGVSTARDREPEPPAPHSPKTP